MKTLALLCLLLGPALIAADAPTPLPAEYQARYDAAGGAGESLVRDMGAEIMALRAQLAALSVLRANYDKAIAERDAALKQVADIRSILTP